MLFASLKTSVGMAVLRDLEVRDVDAIVRYWHESDAEFLDTMGIDRARLGNPENTRQRYLQSIRTGDAAQPHCAFVIDVDGEFAGYTLLNRYTPDRNHSHWHIVDPKLRGAGLSSSLYPYRIKTYFDLFPIERLIHQTRTRNVAVNTMLDKWVPVAETRYIENPDGMALPGEFHLRYVYRKDVPFFLEKAGPVSS